MLLANYVLLKYVNVILCRILTSFALIVPDMSKIRYNLFIRVKQLERVFRI